MQESEEIRPGAKIYAKRTPANQSCGIRPGDREDITHVRSDPGGGNTRISFYLERRGMPGNWIKAICPGGTFGAHFVTAAGWRVGGVSVEELADLGGGLDFNPAYISREGSTKRFPEDCRI